MAEPMIIEVEDLHRSFGDIQAVRGISFSVSRGEVVGFVGANGAGKTTTMRMMAALDMPDSGRIKVCGFTTANFQSEVKKRIGWMPDYYGVYDNMTVKEYLDFFARAYFFSGKERRNRLREVIEYTDLHELEDRYIDTLSKGMIQRLCLGRILLHDPDLLILDEPAAGLDPKARIEFRRLIRLLAEDKTSIFLSSHILTELEDICDQILFIDQGQIVHHGSTESLKRSADSGVLISIRINGDNKELIEWIADNPQLSLQEDIQAGAKVLFERDDPELISSTLKELLVKGIKVIDFHREGRRLEDAFVEILEKNKNR